jgi:hypothetical protein
MQTREGVMKAAAKKAGVSVARYTLNRDKGRKLCRICREWKEAEAYHRDAGRSDGLQPDCKECRREAYARK